MTVVNSGSIGRVAASKMASAAADVSNSTAALTASARTNAESSRAPVIRRVSTTSGFQPSLIFAQCPRVRMAAARTLLSLAFCNFWTRSVLGRRCSSNTHRHSRSACASSRSGVTFVGSSESAKSPTCSAISSSPRAVNSSLARYRVAVSLEKKFCTTSSIGFPFIFTGFTRGRPLAVTR